MPYLLYPPPSPPELRHVGKCNPTLQMSQLSEEQPSHLLRLEPLVLSLLRLDNVRVFCPAHYVQGQTRSSGGHSGKFRNFGETENVSVRYHLP
jgi:hypothetical protein